MRPQFLESFSIRKYLAGGGFLSRKRITCFLSWPDPLPGMISIIGAFLAIASSKTRFSALSISSPWL
jgi:hypothetical protein